MDGVNNFRAWWDNFWYHNKWKTIFVVFLVLVVLIAVMQMEADTEYDAKVLYAGPHLFTAEERASLESAFSQILGSDYNKDQKKNTLLADLTIFTDEQLSELLNSTDDASLLVQYNMHSEDQKKQSFLQEATVGEHIICLLDPHWYEMLKERGGLVELEAVLGYRPEGALDEFGIRVKDLKFGQFYDIFDVLPEDTVLCMRIMSSSMLMAGSNHMKDLYNRHQTILGDVISFEFPAGFVPSSEDESGDGEET